MNGIEKQEEKVWDKKKIAIFLLILTLIGGGLAYGLGNQRTLSSEEIRGTQITEEKEEEPKTETPAFTNIQNTFENKFNEIKEEAESIDVAEVASSSPQIQKVISDIKNLQNYPQNQAKEACFNICEGL